MFKIKILVSSAEILKPLVRAWMAKRLDALYTKDIQNVIIKCHDFFETYEGRIPSSANILANYPKGKNAMSDKFIIGYYSATQIIGFIDIIRDFPQPETWYVNLFLSKPDFRSRGKGQRFFEDICHTLKELGIKKVALHVPSTNAKAIMFFKDMAKMTPVAKEEIEIGEKKQLAFRFEKNLN